MKLKPFRFRYLPKSFRYKTVRFLDVGCGDHSPSLTKKYFPQCEYHGIDRESYNNSSEDEGLIDRYFELDLGENDLSSVPDDHYDIVNFSHVIEHLENGDMVLDRLAKKVRSGGYVYIEFPNMRSLSLPSAKGTLNFCDDATHVRVYSQQEIVNVLLRNNFKICRLGRRRDALRLCLSPLGVLYSLFHKVTTGQFHSRGLWDLLGFADYVVARKR